MFFEGLQSDFFLPSSCGRWALGFRPTNSASPLDFHNTERTAVCVRECVESHSLQEKMFKDYART